MKSLRYALVIAAAALAPVALAQNTGGTGGTGQPAGSTGAGLGATVPSLGTNVGRPGQELQSGTVNQPGFLSNSSLNNGTGRTSIQGADRGFLRNSSVGNRVGGTPAPSLEVNVPPLEPRTTTTATRRAPRVSESTPIFTD
jgi:hypothetical protein